MPQKDITQFETILNKFYDRIEKDEDFFDYYNVNLTEAVEIAAKRSINYLCEALDELSCLSNIDVDLNTQNKDIYNGYLYQTRNNTSGNEYVFFKELQ